MSKDKNKAQGGRQPAAKTPAVPPVPVKVAPLFRKTDWLVFLISFATVWTAYLFTLAPDLTLEDSGELCTASFYAGIPHPPGYPFWAIYSWFWTAILPFGSVAWRVEVGESFAAAMGCGMVSFMVSRGSSMLIEGIDELKSLDAGWERAICMVSGLVAGMMVGFDAFMWSESVVINRISVFGVPWLVLVLLCLMRWIYAPQQRRYLYLAMFLYGICATIHQTLLLSAMGIEVAIAAAQPRLGRDLFLTNSVIYLVGLLAIGSQSIPALNNMSSIEVFFFHTVGIGSILAGGWLSIKTRGIYTEWLPVIIMGIVWVLGVSFYFYEPLAGMTNPPMEWGYPRTLEGFFHALSRGQYDTTHGTDIFHNPMHFVDQLWYLVQGLSESFNWVFMFVGLLPFLFLFKMHKRERSWIIGLTAIYFCLAVLVVILLDVTLDRSSADLNRVFFTASHSLFAMMIGYGLTLMAAYMATHYQKFRSWGFVGGGIAVILALYCLVDATGKHYFGLAGQISLSELPHWIKQAFVKDQYGSPIFANLILVAMCIVFVLALLIYRKRGPVLILLCLFAFMPVYSGLSHWYKSEQRNHWFGYWFGHDMFTPPFGIYPEMTRDAILFGGTDPGRFCPTYMIFCESFVPPNCKPMDPKYDRRDVYIITQNALADGTYLDYIRAQYFRSSQDELKLDTPFFRELMESYWWAFVFPALGISGILVLGFFIQHRPNRKRVAIIIVSIWLVVCAIVLAQGVGFVQGISRAAYRYLDVPFTKLGKSIENRRRAEGVYPPKEIYTPTPEDSSDCFQEYMEDAQRRAALGQLQPGEDVHNEGGRVQVSGQMAVMNINGLLCKVIFDHNPTNDFYVEESFPLQWMYPYETPSGVIMKINRNPLPELPDDVFKKDHEFWSKYSERLIGNWITYDTTVQQIADFAEKLYLRNNFSGFTGDRKFVRDDDGQKAFSKLRSSIAGVYAWRLTQQCPPEYRQKTSEATQALIRETDFAFKQSFAFCPYSPEAVYRYVNFLLQFQRVDDALIIAQTCLKLDPYNDQVKGLISQLETFKKQIAANTQSQNQVQQMEAEAASNPGDLTNLLSLAGVYLQMQQTNRAIALFDQAITNSHITTGQLGAIASFYAGTDNINKLEGVLEKIVALTPGQPEPRYDLAALKAVLGKTDEALQNLKIALDLNALRLKGNPEANDLLLQARTDAHLNSLRNLPEFQKLVPPN